MREPSASWTEWGGRQVVASYGDLQGEVKALREGRALLDRSAWDALALAGPDRRRFLGGLVTCEVQDLEPGQSRYGFFTAREGKVLSDVSVVARDDELLLDLPPGYGEPMAAHLGKYLIADRVEIRRPEIVALTLFGEGSAGTSIAGAEGSERALYGLPSRTVWVEREWAAERWQELMAAGCRPIGVDAVEHERISRGVPRFGRDFGPGDLPQETGLEELAVSYAKGCYLGQEIVARLHYRGSPQRLMRGLLLPPGAPPSVGSEILFAGRPLGTLTSVAPTADGGPSRGLAIVHRRGAAPGTEVVLATGGTAVVSALPFAEDG